jgi:dTDP-4-dehydrorhamnose reductase
MKVLILGDQGMLGSTVSKYLKRNSDLIVKTTSRNSIFSDFNFDVLKDTFSSIEKNFSPDFIVNCIGLIKPMIDEGNFKSVQNAIKTNSLFPHTLNDSFASARIIQIATDCVFSGSLGEYFEDSLHDPNDVYGRTKSLGEVNSENFLNIRTSIIGREIGNPKSLIEWILSQPRDGSINGFRNHIWNGVTTLDFAHAVESIIKNSDALWCSGSRHLIPSNKITKYELLTKIANSFGRTDINIIETDASNLIDRSLGTKFPSFSEEIWARSVYKESPSVETLVDFYSKNV